MSDTPTPLPPGSRKAQDLSGYDELSAEELDRIMMTDEDPVAKAKEEEEERLAKEEAAEDDTVDPNPDDEEDEDEDPAEEAEEEEKAPESKKGQADETAEEDEESPLEKRIRLLERRLELEALERTKETEARRRAELLASKQAGRAGYLQQQLKKSPAKAQATEDDADEDADAEEKAPQNRQERNQPTPDPVWQEDRVELVRMAITDEGNEFAKAHASEFEEMPDAFLNRVQELMKEEAVPYREELMTSSVKTVRKLARSLMNSAYATARIEFADNVADNATREATARKADSAGKSRRRKAKAAISKGSGRAKSAPKPKSYDDMTMDELEAEMKKEFGADYRLGSDMSKHGGL